MGLDYAHRHIVIYDSAAQSFRTIPYTPLEERRDVGKNPGLPAIDRVNRTNTIYAAAEHGLLKFAASDDLPALPASTWRTGDVVRYYN
jgi:hypothetical protein